MSDNNGNGNGSPLKRQKATYGLTTIDSSIIHPALIHATASNPAPAPAPVNDGNKIGGRRTKSNKRKSHKRESSKRKSHKRKSSKRKSHKRKSNRSVKRR